MKINTQEPPFKMESGGQKGELSRPATQGQLHGPQEEEYLAPPSRKCNYWTIPREEFLLAQQQPGQ